MAFSRGPKIITEGLVVNLDVGNIKSFKGVSTTNLLTNITYNLGTNDTSLYKTNYGTEVVNIPKIQGSRVSNYCNIYNDYNGGSGVCCPAIFNFGDFSISTGGGPYTYQIIYRTTTGYNNTNYMYRYEYNNTTYIKEGGMLSNTRIENLGDGWVHAWGTFVPDPNTNRLVTYLFHYEYALQNKVEVAAVSLTQGASVHNPNNLLPLDTRREPNECLFDNSLKKIKVKLMNGVGSSRSITSEARELLTFDGVNDYVDLGNASNFLYNGVVSINVWVLSTVIGSYKKILFTGDAGTNTIRGLYFSLGPAPYYVYFGVTTENGQNSANAYPVNIQTNKWVNICGTFDGLNIKLYINGELVGTQPLTGSINSQGIGRISGYDNNAESWSGAIEQFQAYDRALSANEVKQNYNALKGRYGV